MILKWKPIRSDLEARLARECGKWVGTPYMEGQRARGVGADCVQLVVGVLDSLFRTKTRVPKLPVDTAIHSDESALPVIAAMREAWRGSYRVEDGLIEPGDIVLTRAEAHPRARLRAAHAMLAGVEPWTALHTLPGCGACFTSLEVTRGIVAIYRIKEKQAWAVLSSPFTTL